MGWAARSHPARMHVAFEARDADVVLKICYDSSTSGPRQVCDNLGTMVCFHRRHSLGDPHDFRCVDDFWLSLLEEALGDAERARRKLDAAYEAAFRDGLRGSSCHKAAHGAVIGFLERRGYVFLPLYLYDHSGLAVSTEPFPCPWDSGQVGWIYASPQVIREEYGVKRVTKKLRRRVAAVLEAEVRDYSTWLEGDVYGYVLEDAGGNLIDSCWGFYGDNWRENGLVDHLPEEYRYLLDRLELAA